MPPVHDERRSRLFEVAITIAVSAVTSAIAVTWTMSSMVTRINSTLEMHERRITAAETTQDATRSLDSAQAAQLAVSDTRWQEVQRRLDSIDLKLDKRK